MRAGIKGLGLSPDVFWAMTPAELAIMFGTSSGKGPLLSDGLATLMAAYPDQKKETCDG